MGVIVGNYLWGMGVIISICFIFVVCVHAWTNPGNLSPSIHLLIHVSSTSTVFI